MFGIEPLAQAVQQQKFPPVYLWHASDRFLLQEAMQTLKEPFLRMDPSGSCIETVSARDLSPAAIVDAANSFSFFPRRLVLVENIPYFQDGDPSDLQPFYDYFANPNPQTCLVFLAEHVNRSRKFYKAVEQAGKVLQFEAPQHLEEWQAWLRRELRDRGKTMEGAAVELFFLQAGQHPGVVAQELEKLILYVGERGRICVEHVRDVTTGSVEASIFELLDAVAERSPALALQKLTQVLAAEYPLKVLTMMVRQVRLLLGAAALRQQGGNQAGLPEALGIRPYEAHKIWRQSARLSFPALAAALKECLKTELALKSGRGDPALLLEMLVIKFCQTA